MEPNWVRPTYLRVMSAIGIVLMAYGLLGFVMGVVHVADPDLQRQSDPIFRIASAVVDVANAAYAKQSNPNPTATDALSKAKTELDHQARQGGLNQLVRGLVLLLIGLGIFWFHWKKAEEPRPQMVAAQPYGGGGGGWPAAAPAAAPPVAPPSAGFPPTTPPPSAGPAPGAPPAQPPGL